MRGGAGVWVLCLIFGVVGLEGLSAQIESAHCGPAAIHSNNDDHAIVGLP